MKGGCHCGAVSLTLDRAPDGLNKCNCSLCRKLGVLWAYYRPAEVAIAGETRDYVRADMGVPSIRAHFCGGCGAVTHWSSLDPARNRCGVNMRLFDPAALAGVTVRFVDARAWPQGPRDAVYHPSMPFEDHIA